MCSQPGKRHAVHALLVHQWSLVQVSMSPGLWHESLCLAIGPTPHLDVVPAGQDLVGLFLLSGTAMHCQQTAASRLNHPRVLNCAVDVREYPYLHNDLLLNACCQVHLAQHQAGKAALCDRWSWDVCCDPRSGSVTKQAHLQQTAQSSPNAVKEEQDLDPGTLEPETIGALGQICS